MDVHLKVVTMTRIKVTNFLKEIPFIYGVFIAALPEQKRKQWEVLKLLYKKFTRILSQNYFFITLDVNIKVSFQPKHILKTKSIQYFLINGSFMKVPCWFRDFFPSFFSCKIYLRNICSFVVECTDDV